MMDALFHGLLSHGPWAVFSGILFIAYYRLVNDVIAVTRKNTETQTEEAEAIKQVVQVMVEVKDAINKCKGPRS